MRNTFSCFVSAAISVALLACSAPLAAHWDGGRADAHAPISVMGDHVHKRGEWMLSYRYMGMTMDGNRKADERLTDSEAFAQLPGMGAMNMKVLPVDMQMEMHMLGVMYAPSDTVTLMLMLPHASTKMTHKVQMMGNVVSGFKTQTSATGDVFFGALVKFFQAEGVQAHFNLGIGLANGSITEQDDTPMGKQQLPYAMQPGSGSEEFRPGVTLLGQRPAWSWGVQAGASLALEDNNQGYQLGDRFQLSGWIARRVNDFSSVSLLTRKKWWRDIEGKAKDLMVSGNVNPAADPLLQSGQRMDVGLGLNLLGREGSVKGHRLALEYLLPVQQSIDGPRLETDATYMIGWQKAFGG